MSRSEYRVVITLNGFEIYRGSDFVYVCRTAKEAERFIKIFSSRQPPPALNPLRVAMPDLRRARERESEHERAAAAAAAAVAAAAAGQQMSFDF